MHRFQRLSTTASTLNAQLFEHERVLVDKEGVGLYDGKDKTVAFDNGRMYLTTHRLIYLDAAQPQRNSRYLDLPLVKQTEYWAGFLKSSAKITLVLGDSPANVPDAAGSSHQLPQEATIQTQSALYDDESLHPSSQTWACHVCGFRNLASSGSKCGLCGVTRPNDIVQRTTSSRKPASTPPGRPFINGSEPASGTATPTLDPAVTGALISCPSCTFLNHPSMVRCEVCDSPLGTFASTRTPSRASTPVVTSRPGTPSTAGPPTPALGSNGSSSAPPTFVRLSFRRGGDKTFYAALKKALQAKEWDVDRKLRSRRPAASSQVSGDNLDQHRTTTIGIDGILRTIDLDARDKEDDMQEALSDLEALMTRAKDMVSLAQSLNAKVIENKAGQSEDAASADQASTVVWQSLTSLGLQAPAVTSEMVADDKEYHLQLAKELGSVLLGTGKGRNSVPVMQDGPKAMIGLDEIWCLWNRARGVALVSPKDLKQACEQLPLVTKPQIRLRTFKSGLTVLHLPYFSEEAFASRICSTLAPEVSDNGSEGDAVVPGVSTLDVARKEGLSVVLTERMLELLEQQRQSVIARDEGDTRQGTRWQYNYFEVLERQQAL